MVSSTSASFGCVSVGAHLSQDLLQGFNSEVAGVSESSSSPLCCSKAQVLTDCQHSTLARLPSPVAGTCELCCSGLGSSPTFLNIFSKSSSHSTLPQVPRVLGFQLLDFLKI